MYDVGAEHSLPGPRVMMESNVEDPTSCTIGDIDTETTRRSMRKCQVSEGSCH